MALFKGDILIAGTNPSGGGAGGGHVIQDSSGVEFEQRPALQFIGADVVDDETNSATQVITPSFREIQGDIPDTNLVCLDGIPIGGIIPYGAPINTLSQDWLPCLGQAVSRTFYHELFEKYGTIYGDGDGSTTFNLPNYGGRVPVGLAKNDTDFDTLGATLGEKKHTLTINEMPSHKHSIPYRTGGGGGSTWYTDPGTAEGYSDSKASAAGGGQAHNNIQPSIVSNYIVKAKTSSHTITTSNVMTVHNESDENTYSCNYINSHNLKSSIIHQVTPNGATNHAFYGGTFYYKIGSRVHVHIGIKLTSTADTNIFTLPVGFRPYTIIGANGLGNITNSTSGVQITSDGSVTVNTQNSYALIDVEFDTFES